MAEKVLGFRVDIKGVTEEAKGIARIDDELKKLNTTRRDAIKEATKEGTLTKENGLKISKLNSKITDLKTRKSELVKTEKLLSKEFFTQKNTINALNVSNAKLVAKSKDIDITTKKGRESIRALNNEINANNKLINKNVSALERQKRGIGGYLKSILGAAGLIGGVGLVVNVFKKAVNAISDFTKAQSELIALSGQTREELKGLTKQAKQLGGQTEFTATQVTKLQTELIKLGFATSEIKLATKDILNFASATGAELSDAAKVAGIALRIFNIDASRASEVSSTLAVATTKSALAFGDYETILSTVGPIAKAYGFTLQDTIALTGKLRDAGFDASTAATATRNILLNLADVNGALAKELGGNVRNFDDLTVALTQLDDRGIDLASTLELTDKRSVAAFNQFLTGAESAVILRDSITDVNDELQIMVDTRLDNLAGDVTKLSSAWEGFVLKGEEGVNVFRGVIKFVNNLILKLANLDTIFVRSSRYTAEQIERTYDLMFALTDKSSKKFQETINKYSKTAAEDLGSVEEAFKEELKGAKLNRGERQQIWDEFLRRRSVQIDLELAAEGDRLKSIADLKEKEKRLALIAATDKNAKEREKAAEERYKASVDLLKLQAETEIDELFNMTKDFNSATDEYFDSLINTNVEKEKSGQAKITAEAKKGADDRAEIIKQEQATIEQLRRNFEDKALAVINFSEQLGNTFEDLFSGQEDSFKTFSKNILLQTIDFVKQTILIARARVLVESLSQPDSVATFGASGIARAAIINGLISAGFAGLKAVINRFEEGGLVPAGNELPGAPLNGDNTLALVKPDEVILNKDQQSKLGGYDVFKSIGVPGFAKGGAVGKPVQTSGLTEVSAATRSMIEGLAQIEVTLNINKLNKKSKELELIQTSKGL